MTEVIISRHCFWFYKGNTETVPVKNELPNEATCTKCGRKIRNRGKQIEDLATGTLGLHRRG